MYKNQLHELAQRTCFNLPSYTFIKEGPDHAPRFKAIVNFNGETFYSPNYCSTLRHAEHSAAETALISLSSRGGAARILDETGVYKNLLQETAQRVGSPLPHYTTFRSGLGHLPVFTGTVELAGITFTGEMAKNKKQAEKNAALAAWLSLKQLAREDATTSSEHENNSEEQQQIKIARALQNYRSKAMMINPNSPSTPFHNKSPLPSPQRPALPTSKILPLFSHKAAASRNRLPPSSAVTQSRRDIQTTMKFPAVGPTPYATPFRQCGMPHRGVAQPVTMRNVVPVFSAPPPSLKLPADDDGILVNSTTDVDESTAVRCMEQLEI